jgi:enoyl-CoA hydratase/carnithine racemase
MGKIVLDRTGQGVATVTIHNPEQRNSVTYAMWCSLAETFSRLSSDRSVRTILFTGAGADFSAGADISEFAKIRDDLAKAKAYEVAVDAACTAITNAPQPVIAVMRGYTLGGGAHLAMSADFRFVQHDAVCGIPAARLSIIYGVGGTRKLLALVGLSNAKRILFSAGRFDAAEALQMGFADRICEDPMDEALAFAQDLSELAPLSQAGAKYILNGLALGQFDAATADALIDAAAASEDYAEGRAAFSEKRKPRFVGR